MKWSSATLFATAAAAAVHDEDDANRRRGRTMALSEF